MSHNQLRFFRRKPTYHNRGGGKRAGLLNTIGFAIIKERLKP